MFVQDGGSKIMHGAILGTLKTVLYFFMYKYSTEKVLTVKDLATVNKFGLFESNRDIDENHVKNIKKAILAGIPMPDVIIELRTLKIIDGQHRLAAIRELMEEGYEVSISVVFKDYGGSEDAAMAFAHSINANQKGWTDKNYVGYWKTKPNHQAYAELEKFASTHSLCYSIRKTGNLKGTKNLKLTTAARLVLGPDFKRKSIREGGFKASADDFENAAYYHNEINRILTIKGYVTPEKTCPNIGNSFESMITGWINFRNKPQTMRRMEKVGGFDGYCLRVDNLDMSVCTNTQEWQSRFAALLPQD